MVDTLDFASHDANFVIHQLSTTLDVVVGHSQDFGIQRFLQWGFQYITFDFEKLTSSSTSIFSDFFSGSLVDVGFLGSLMF